MNRLAALSLEELLFVNHYVEHRDVGEAVRACAERFAEQTPERLKAIGEEMLENSIVRDELMRRLRVQATAASISQSDVLVELAHTAFFDLRQLFDDNGDMLPIHKLDKEATRGLAHFDVIQMGDRGQIVKLVPNNKLKALELLGKHFKMFTDKVEVESSGNLSVNLDWIQALPAPTDGTDDAAGEDDPD